MFAEINNTKIHFYDSGNLSAHPIIFLHAFPLNHKMWMNQSYFFRNDFRVIAPDFRGFGQSSKSNYNFSMDLFAEDILFLMDYLQIKSATICSLSMGGYVAFRCFEKYPERFSSLILSSTRSEADTIEGKNLRLATIEKINKDGLKDFANNFVNNFFTSNISNEDKNNIIQMILNTDPLSVCGALIALSERIDSNYLLEKINIPTCIIVGEDDKLTPVSCSENLNRSIKKSELHIIKSASHLCNIEKSKEFNNIIFSFLKNNIK